MRDDDRLVAVWWMDLHARVLVVRGSRVLAIISGQVPLDVPIDAIRSLPPVNMLDLD